MTIWALKELVKARLPKPILDQLFKVTDLLRDRYRGYLRFVDPKRSSSATKSSHGDCNHALVPWFDLLREFDHRNPVAIDCAHNVFIVGAVLSKKPRQILELGIGTGYLTMSLVHALKYNQKGQLTSVDNWFDTRGVEPKLGADLRSVGANVVCSSEEDFIRQAAEDSFDFLISDADHQNSARWFDQHIRITENGGFMFFHDTNLPRMFPGLATVEARARELGLPCYQFKESSRDDESCERGLLFVLNKKLLN